MRKEGTLTQLEARRYTRRIRASLKEDRKERARRAGGGYYGEVGGGGCGGGVAHPEGVAPRGGQAHRQAMLRHHGLVNTTVLVGRDNCYGIRKEILLSSCTKFQKYDVKSQESCQKWAK